MSIQVTANPSIGCKYPATVNGLLVRSMATVIRTAANNHKVDGQPFSHRRPINPDPNEGNAYGYQS